MNSNTAVGIFMLVTSLTVLVPLVVQLREGRFRFREVWGLFVLVGGFAIVGIAYTVFDGSLQLALVGLAAVVFGLLIQHNRRDDADSHTKS